MPMGYWDGTAGHDMKNVGYWDGTAGHDMKNVSYWDGTTGHPIWRRGGEAPSQKTETMEVSGPQDNTWHYKTLLVGDYSTISVENFTPAQSYGSASTYLAVYRNGWLHYTLRDVTRTYNGTSFSDTANRAPQDVYSGLQPGDEIKLAFQASFDPNVSGQGTSTARAIIKLSK